MGNRHPLVTFFIIQRDFSPKDGDVQGVGERSCSTCPRISFGGGDVVV